MFDFEINTEILYSFRYYANINIPNNSKIELKNFFNEDFIFAINNEIFKESYFPFHIKLALMYKLNNNQLCDIEIKKDSNQYSNKIEIKVILNKDLIYDNLNDPLIKEILDLEYYKLISKCQSHNGLDVEDKSFIPYCNPCNLDLKIKNKKLFSYQKKTLQKMIEIENKSNNKSNVILNHTIKFGDNFLNINPLNGSINETNDNKFSIVSSGGILADVMGLGKTLTSLSLIKANTNQERNFTIVNNLINTNCSLIICPNHLVSQWEKEAKSSYPKLKIIKFLTKNNHNKTTYEDITKADLVLVSHQFLMNFKHYPSVDYRYVTPAIINLQSRINELKNKFNNWKNNIDELKKKTAPLLEFFYFKRIFVDEGHEIFGGLANSNMSLSNYIMNLFEYFNAENFWFVSGTPFSNKTGFINALKFIKLRFVNDGVEEKINDNTFRNMKYLNNNIMKERLINDFIVRHRKEDIVDEVEILGYDETIIWVEQTEMEKNLYRSKVGKTSNMILQQLCCHPLIAESFSKMIGNKEVNLDTIKDEMIKYHKNTINIYSKKLTLLDPNSQQFHMLKSTFSKKVSESKYMLSILEKLDKVDEIKENENCSVCFDTLEEPTLTSCGHLFCNDCLKMCLNVKNECPMCKTNLSGKELIKIDKAKINISKEKKNPLIEKYGAKLGKLISVIRYLTSNENNRIIVFSQWDNMLRLLSSSLSENGVGNSIVKGNVWARNSAINKFKNGVNKLGGENKVIMLSLNNAASGTNLTEATHIFFIEPINADKKEVIAIEGQAIGRACRLGQKDKVNIVRILTKDTIEEEIFEKNYKTNTFVPIDNVINMPNEIDV